MYSVVEITAPLVEPVSTAEAVEHLVYEETDLNDYIDSIVTACRSKIEEEINCKLITTTLKLTIDKFPLSSYDAITLPYSPLQSISFIKYYDSAGVLQTWPSDQYVTDVGERPAKIYPVYGVSWPSARNQPSAVQVQFVCGYGDAAADVPQPLIVAIKLLLTHVFENRSATDFGSIKELPVGLEWWLKDYRVRSF